MFVLKRNDSFAILDACGNIWGKTQEDHNTSDGLVHKDTRVLSRGVLTIGSQPLRAVESSIKEDNVIFEARLTNAATGNIPESSLEIKRTIFLWNDNLYEKTEVRNNNDFQADIPLELSLAADFQDIFELRGTKRRSKGQTHPVEQDAAGIKYGYTGLDNVQRKSSVKFSQPPAGYATDAAQFNLQIAPHGEQIFYTKMGVDDGGAAGMSKEIFEDAKQAALSAVQQHLDRRPKITSSNKMFEQWVRQNAVDITLLTTELKTGLYPYAGIPWYSAAFGRDGIFTAFETLWQDPLLAKGVLSLLADKQAKTTSAFHDCEPGKILHETRSGEMANLDEVPYSAYYGAADTTPLFVCLASAYCKRTGDTAFMATLWPHIEQALSWIDQYGDKDGDGFVEYQRGAETGLGNQGWKDSQDSISHADGTLAQGAIALCEIQGYVYAAKQAAADMARQLGKNDMALRLEDSAARLKEKFNKEFWSEELEIYALALDGNKKPCLVNSSNPGHLLFSGIVPEERAAKIVEKLMSPEMFSGWGIRTLGSAEKRYEPVKHPEGYHNGTIWVHDTAVCAAGFERYHMGDKATALLTALFEAAQHFPGMRLPELFGGLARDTHTDTGPALYPVACHPQAWASGAESMLVEAMLGIRIDGKSKKVTVESPHLPAWLDDIAVNDLKIGNSTISLKFQRLDKNVDVTVISKSSDISFEVVSPPTVPDVKQPPPRKPAP